jgi:hypothetical protein
MATPEQIAERLRRLERSGRLLPADVVEDARPPRSLLHSHFEWNNDVAAEHYRLSQAARLIRMVRIDVTVREVPLSCHAYIRDPTTSTPGRGYRSFVTLRTDEDASRAAIIDEMTRVSAAVRRTRTLAAALGFVDELDKIEDLAHSIVGRTQDLDAGEPAGEA